MSRSWTAGANGLNVVTVVTDRVAADRLSKRVCVIFGQIWLAQVSQFVPQDGDLIDNRELGYAPDQVNSQFTIAVSIIGRHSPREIARCPLVRVDVLVFEDKHCAANVRVTGCKRVSLAQEQRSQPAFVHHFFRIHRKATTPRTANAGTTGNPACACMTGVVPGVVPGGGLS